MLHSITVSGRQMGPAWKLCSRCQPAMPFHQNAPIRFPLQIFFHFPTTAIAVSPLNMPSSHYCTSSKLQFQLCSKLKITLKNNNNTSDSSFFSPSPALSLPLPPTLSLWHFHFSRSGISGEGKNRSWFCQHCPPLLYSKRLDRQVISKCF